MNGWIERGDDAVQIDHHFFRYDDPAGTLSVWRKIKLERGLIRHPSPSVRVAACRELLRLGTGQDECWEVLSDQERANFQDSGDICCSGEMIAATRKRISERAASGWWLEYQDQNIRRALTAINNRRMRLEFCRLYTREYPSDRDNGCRGSPPSRYNCARGR